MEGEEVMAPPADPSPPTENGKPKKRNGPKRKSSVTSLVGQSTPEKGCSRRHSLRRGSSFTFLTPSTQWDFTLKRKRKEKDDDSFSLCSFDLKVTRRK
ncbi:neuroepithelial cell-transforming gene 1 protein-like [Leptodactylus fuscus]|uniref:neuroepithelial cell-transforming gene 1 protein-like n=1 Tax=Leptodactylus fuscus TaxID=238119 RepID=UPI003F4EB15D